jgi:putative Ca2+/H+ antiporter (TMEM165/GDT1 family)
MGKTKRPYVVALGGLAGIAVITLIGVILGSIISDIIPLDFVPLVAGTIFLWIGINEIKEGEGDAENSDNTETNDLNSNPEVEFYTVFKSSFSLIGLAEIGDKSQLFVIARAIDGNLVAIFLGAVIGMGVIMFATAYFGGVLIVKLPEDKIQRLANYGFVIAGVIIITGGLINLL